MESIYANSFSISTVGEEVHLAFRTQTPTYGEEDNKFKENKTVKEHLVIMTLEGYDHFRKMLEEAEKEKEDEKNGH